MKKQFFLGAFIGIVALVCIGATTMLIKDYPARTTPIGTDLFLIDTGTNYQNLTYTALSGQILTSPTVTGPLTVNGTSTFNGSTGTNVIGGVNEITNINGLTIYTSTNQATQVVDMDVPEADFGTNASFNFTGFSNVAATRYQTAVTFVTNSLGSAIVIGAPAGCHYEGTWYCTNVTSITWFCNAGRWTNAVSFPLW